MKKQFIATFLAILLWIKCPVHEEKKNLGKKNGNKHTEQAEIIKVKLQTYLQLEYR